MVKRTKKTSNRRTAVRTASVALPTVSVGGTIGGELHTFAIETDDTIQSVFERAGFAVEDGTEILCRQTAEPVSKDSAPVAGQIYYLSQKFVSQNK